MASDAEAIAGHVGLLRDRVRRQISIFSAISIASLTSMPRYLTVLSIYEWLSLGWHPLRLRGRW